MTITRFAADGLASYVAAVTSARPALALAGLEKATLSDGAGVALWGTSFTAIPRVSDVISATHSVVVAEDASGSITVELSLNDAGFNSGTTWLGRPSPTGTPVSVVLSSPSAGDQIDFDVQDLVGDAVATAAFPGWQYTVTSGADLVIDQTASFTTVEWESPGAKASGLSPQGVVGLPKPTLSGFPSHANNCRIQIDPDEHGFGSPAFETGTEPLDKPELDLAGTLFPGLTSNVEQWWRGSFKFPSKGWGDWSDPIEMTYLALLGLVITSPSAAYPVVTDQSPTITWATSGGTQVKYRVFLTLVGDGDRTVIYDSGVIVGSEHSHTIPGKDSDGKVILKDGREYRVWVMVWDGLDRVAIPGADVFSREAQVFTFQSEPGVPPFSYFVAEAASPGSPVVAVRCGRLAGGPDQILLWRDLQVIQVIEDPSTVVDPDTGDFRILDWEATPNVEHDWYATAVVNGSTSVPGQHSLYTPVVEATWAMNRLNGWSTKLHGVTTLDGLSLSDQQALTQPSGQSNVNKRFNAKGFYAGPIRALIYDDDPSEPGARTRDSYLADLRRMCNNPTVKHVMAYEKYAWPALLGSIDPRPWSETVDVTEVRFEVLQQEDWTIFDDLPAPGDPLTPAPDDLYTYEAFSDGHALGIGDADITATSGSPEVHAAPVLHTGGEKSWSGGGITRPLLDGSAFTDDVYFMIDDDLGSASSIFTLKNPGGTGENPADIRLRTAGAIDIKAFGAVVVDTSNVQWQKNTWMRGSLRGTWTPDATLGASMGWTDLTVWLRFGSHVEEPFPDDILTARFPSVAPVNISNGSPSDTAVNFEVSRRWGFPFMPYAYGVPPVPGLGEPGNGLWLGDATQTTFLVSSYANSYVDGGGITVPIEPTDLIGLNRSASSAMTSVTSYTAAVPDADGWNKWAITSLTANTVYFWQRTVNGTPFGQVNKGKTYKAAGTPQTVKIAATSCKQNSPASTACAVDMVSFAPDRVVNFGDLGYPDDLSDSSQVPVKANWARQITDPAMQAVAALCSMEYMTSDHDVNGSHGISNQPNFHDATSQQSMDAWVAVVPAVVVDARTPKRARYRSMVEGNYRYVWLDTRSWDKSDGITSISDDHDSSKTMLGATQLAWLKAEVDAAAAAHQFVFLYTDPAWNGRAEIAADGNISTSTSDKWPAYGFERDLISDYLYSKLGYLVSGVKRVNCLILFGDTHALQQDDGTNEKNHIASICCGPFAQNVHANFVDAYQRTFPANAGDHVGKQPTQMSYQQVTATESPAGTVNVHIVGRDCTPKHTGTPLTPAGFDVTYGPYTL